MSDSETQRHCEQVGEFESGEKDSTLETFDFMPLSSFRLQPPSIKAKQQQVAWKFFNCSEPSLPRRSSMQSCEKNIQFIVTHELQQRVDSLSSESQKSYQDQEKLSSLGSHYQGCLQIYRKRYDFGTSWIGRRQFYSSTFVKSTQFEKYSLKYYSQQEIPNQQLLSKKELQFDSNFESGNLFSVQKVGRYEYDLILQNDFNTKGNTQWFYFKVANLRRNEPTKLNIVNLRKSDSLFNYGMLPCIHSFQEQKRTQAGWTRSGTHVKYFRNELQIENSKRYYHTLTFTISTPYEGDVLRVAQCYPYSYSDLNQYLETIEKIKYKKEMIERQVILNTIGRNKIQCITIKENNSKAKNRPLIIVIARQHPGETPGSFVCEGFIDFMLSKEKESEYLRKNYEIKVIPMVNPDGVCAGNYRTNLLGLDLNRRWDESRSKNHQEALHVRRYITQLYKSRRIAIVLDLHGHSRKLFSFFYGNPNPGNPCETRIFPLICSKLSPNFIRFEDSSFVNDQYKRNTARIQLFLSLKLPNIYTFESSFFGYSGKNKERKHYTQDGYREMGAALGKAIFLTERGRQLYDSMPDNKQIGLYKKCWNQLRNNPHLIALGETLDSGSESSPEQCEVRKDEEEILEQSDNYIKEQVPAKSIKIIKRKAKKEPLKFPSRSERQMQVLDVAQVNSLFPNNVLALIPSSFLSRKKKSCSNQQVQTEYTPLIKIYETCKQQEHRMITNSQSLGGKSQSQIEIKSQLLKSSILSKQRSATSDKQLQSSAFSSKSQRKDSYSKRGMRDGHMKGKSQGLGSIANRGRTEDKQSQTYLTFNCGMTPAKSLIEKEITILQFKTIDPSFNSFQQSRRSIKSRTGSIHMLQTAKPLKKIYL